MGLARGYANLGLLSETQWTADHLAYKARSLLYAERAFRIEKESPFALRGMGYANVVVGVLNVGLFEFDEADKRDGGKSAPPWVPVIRAYGHSDAGALAKLATERPNDPAPLFFRFVLLSRASGLYVKGVDRLCRSEIIGAGRALTAALPDCYRVLDGMSDTRGVSNLHTATTLSPETFAAKMPARLMAVPNLPKAVAEGISAAKGDEVDLREQLVAASLDDASDLTWGVLAKQLREIRFGQVVRRLNFLAYLLNVSPRDEAIADAPLIRDHPNRAYVDTFIEADSSDKIVPMLESLDLADIESKDGAILQRIMRPDPPLYQRLNSLGSGHVSVGLPSEQEQRLARVDESAQYRQTLDVLILNPDSPIARAALIRLKWDQAAPKAKAWANDHGGDTAVIAELGFHLLDAGKIDEARQRFEAAMQRSPDRWIFDGLVATYRVNGETDRWIKAVGEFLKTEDQSLDHAAVTRDLAVYLMEQKEYAKARPWAELSAQSGAGWAMILASRCAEAMKDWNEAEAWMARTSERYASSRLDWYAWCKRTGHGDARAAAAFVEARLEEGEVGPSDADTATIAAFLLLEGRLDDARKFAAAHFREPRSTSIGVLLAIVQDRIGDKSGRDATIKALSRDPKPLGPKTAKLVGLVGEWLVKGDKAPLDLKPIEAILSEIPPAARPASQATLALFLDHHGKRDLASGYFKQANTKDCSPMLRALAIDALRARGINTDVSP